MSNRELTDFTDVMVDVITGYECNVKCDYCSVLDELRCQNMTTAEIIGELTTARSMGIHKVSFGGGEPTIRKDLVSLVRYCRDRGFDFVKISSNGLLYQYDDFAARLVEAGVTRFNLSVMAHTEELYGSIMGLEGALGMVQKGVANLVALGQEPILDLIIKNDTYLHLPDIVDFWANEGVRTFVLWLVSLTDRNRDNMESMPRVSLMKEDIIRTFERSHALGVRCESRHIPRCMLPGYEEFVRDLRQDRVRVVTPGAAFNLWESDISANTYADKCRKCRYFEAECMGARKDYLERYGDAELEPVLPEKTAGN